MLHSRDDGTWTARARCAGQADEMFGETQDQKHARAVCSDCPVRKECLTEALSQRIEWGVWGGMTERERRRLLRQSPEVTDWRAIVSSLGETGTLVPAR